MKSLSLDKGLTIPTKNSPVKSSLKRAQLIPFFILCFGLFGLNNLAQAESKPASTFSANDREFVMAAAQGGMTEVSMGKLAEDKGTTTAIRDFGAMMVKDHSKINNDVKALAKKKGVSLPSVLDAKHQAKVDALGKLSGKDFDKAYLADMTVMHKKDLAAFTEARAATSDPDLKALLDKAIPIVKAHIEHLKNFPTQS